MRLPDFFSQAMHDEKWQVLDGARLEQDETWETDVVIIGTGAGGGTAAEILSRAGLRVVMIEEGALRTSQDFQLEELEAYTGLYQEGMTRSTRDGAIGILQGRTVGGSTTVNWTSSFRTPDPTLHYWQERFGVKGLGPDELTPWFQRMEERFSITEWLAPNRNNEVLLLGCEKLGIPVKAIHRNVKGCWNLGYCGLGCPTNAKQSMLVTTIPEALRQGSRLVHRLRVQKLFFKPHGVEELLGEALGADGKKPTGRTLRVRAKHFILASGAIGSPAILLRSEAPDPYRTLGRRTFLHPSVFAFARFADETHPYHGAPQSIYTDHFQWQYGVSGRMGFKIEAAPLQPVFASVIMRGHGSRHRQRMEQLDHTAGSLALLRDGFHESSPGGSVMLTGNGSPVLDYPLTDYVLDGVKRAYAAIGEIYFAAGATAVFPGHGDAEDYTNLEDFRQGLDRFVFEKLRMRLGSAHVMGGCGMSEHPRHGVVNSQGQHHQLENLHVWDGSLFPTSIGANPQLSIYGIVSKMATHFVENMGKEKA
ncbi:MAG TPA: GMC family oxidoreductase [Oligoflexus sp.]|uniref:GMC family oxidoreductase n=1 Tax=Oligoflexus sp. TaxID=1971216 RepID=UPI002D37654D|nr:GMC family oxidoreductase [Oligoflexus sp.]HYX37071.1 GMC family oxidoreductase [Oligoflexus sp.]